MSSNLQCYHRLLQANERISTNLLLRYSLQPKNIGISVFIVFTEA